jgi:hypothetical protein
MAVSGLTFCKYLQIKVLVQVTYHWERFKSGFVHFIGKWILNSRGCKTTQHSLHSSNLRTNSASQIARTTIFVFPILINYHEELNTNKD